MNTAKQLTIKEIPAKTGYFLIAAFIFLLLLSLLGNMRTEFGPFRLVFGFSWGWPGESRLIIPPLGEIKAFTHHWPVVLSVTLDRIDLALLQHELMGVTNPNQYIMDFLPRLRMAAYLFLAKLILLGGVAGGITGWLFGWRRFAKLWRVVAVGALSVLLIIGGVLLDYDQEAFRNPRYEGALEAAPWVMGLIDRGLNRLPELSAKLSLVAGNLNRLFTQVDNLDPLARVDGELKVLHVSDIHNNPAGLEFIGRVIEGFGADLVIDTGDLTDYGTALETELMRKIRSLGVKYVFIPGNHDSPEVVAGMKKFPNVVVLEKGLYKFRDLTILGWGDPAARMNDKLMAGDEELKTEAELLKEYFGKLAARPDILAIHNVKLAEEVADPPPVVLYGHDHRPAIHEKQQTVYVDAGTSGAAGFRGLENDTVPYSVALLRFDRPEGEKGYQLTAVDLIRIYSLNSKFILERKVIKHEQPVPVEGGGEN